MGESPTAPPPFAVQNYTGDDVNPYIADPGERAKLRDLLSHARNDGMFTPAGFDNTMQAAGNNGGANWGNAVVDPTTKILYVQSKNAPAILQLAAKHPKLEIKGSPETKGQLLYLQNCQACHTSELQVNRRPFLPWSTSCLA